MTPTSGVPINGKAVREIRKARGLNLSTLARDALLSVGYLSNIEAGRKTMVSPEARQRIADRLQVEDIDSISYMGAAAERAAS